MPQTGEGGCTRKPIAILLEHLAVAGVAMLLLTQATDEASAKESREGAGRGEANYAIYCSPCHGVNGNGKGPMAALLDPKPARHRDSVYMKTLSDDYMFRVIRSGGPAVGKSSMMAPWKGTLSDLQIRDLVTYIRSLAQ
jgi:mono/diheme cytochrome c family protein